MSAQLPARDILAFNMYQEIQVSKYLNGLYDFLFLGEYDRNIKGIDIINNEMMRYEKQFKKTNDEFKLDDYKDKLFNIDQGKLLSGLKKELDYTEGEHSNYDIDSKLKESILYLLFNKYKNYNLLTQIKDPSKLIIIPDYYESNTTTLKDYFTDINLNDTLKRNLPEYLKENESSQNVFFLKVFLKSDMDIKNYQEIIKDEFKRLDSFLQQQFAIAISDLSKQTNNPIKPFKEIIFLVNNKGLITDDYYKSNTIKTKKYLELLNEELIKYLNNNKNANINIGIQRKKLNNKILINPFYNHTFKQLSDENNIFKIIKNRVYSNITDPKDRETKIINDISIIKFVHFVINEIYKEFFDKKYKINQITITEEKDDAYLNIYFRYNILNDDNDYDIKKIVFNSSAKCQLEIDDLPNYKISGHFNSKSKFYSFKITYIDPIDFENEDNKTLLSVLLEEIKKKKVKIKDTENAIKNLLKNHQKLFGLNEDIIEGKHINFKNNISIHTFFVLLYNYENDIEEHLYLFIEDKYNTISTNKQQKRDDASNIIEYEKKNLDLLTTIIKKLNELPNYREIMFFILNYDDIKLRINKTNYSINFTVLDKIDEKNITIYQDKFYGILKKYKTLHYYEEFTLNRINNTLGDNKKIYFYQDLYITKDILVNFLKKNDNYDNKIKARQQIPYKLLKILNNNVLLNDLFLYVYENNRSNIYIDNEPYQERSKESSDFNMFKRKAIESLVNIIFTKGTPFYISRINKENKNSTSKINYASYTIDKINNLNYITKYTDKTKWETFVNKNYFHGSIQDSKNILRKYGNFLNNTEITNNSILSKKNKKDENRFISFSDFSKKVEEITKKKENNDNITIVILDFDLIPSNLVGIKQTCKTRKKRIGNKLLSMFNKQMQKVNIFTRKLKNKFKTTRKKRKAKNSKIRLNRGIEEQETRTKRSRQIEISKVKTELILKGKKYTEDKIKQMKQTKKS